MALIEGIGDEVLLCFGGLVLVGILTLAWFSTNVRPVWHSGSVWLVHLQTHPNRRVLQVVSLDERQLEQTPNNANAALDNTSDSSRATRRIIVEPTVAAATRVDAEPTVDVVESDDSHRVSASIEEATSECEPSPSPSPVESLDAVAESSSGGSASNSAESTIKLKFLDDTQRLVGAWMSQTVGQFKRQHFTTEVSQGKTIRLIYQGQLLRDDGRSLESYGLRDNCVLHCHVGTIPYAQPAGNVRVPESGESTRNSRPNDDGRRSFEPGQYIYFIFGFKFIALWMAWYAYPQLFGAASAVSLIACTGLYLLFVFNGRRRPDEQQPPVPQNVG